MNKIVTYQVPKRNLAPFSVSYLWEWKDEEGDVARLIYALKNSHLPEAQERLALLWLHCFPSLISLRKPSVIVYPTKNLASQDHAFYLARFLAGAMNIPIHPLLVASSATPYRLLGRRDRYQQRRVIKDLKVRAQEILFVDDVFTTGATAVRAWQSLGEPKGFQVCVLAYKGFRLRFEG